MILNHPLEVNLILFASNAINVSQKDLIVKTLFGSTVTVAIAGIMYIVFLERIMPNKTSV